MVNIAKALVDTVNNRASAAFPLHCVTSATPTPRVVGMMANNAKPMWVVCVGGGGWWWWYVLPTMIVVYVYLHKPIHGVCGG